MRFIGLFLLAFLLSPQVLAVKISWTASSTPGVSYNVYHTGSNVPLNSVPIDGLSYIDSGLDVGRYTYFVRATKYGFESPDSMTAEWLELPKPPETVVVEQEEGANINVIAN